MLNIFKLASSSMPKASCLAHRECHFSPEHRGTCPRRQEFSESSPVISGAPPPRTWFVFGLLGFCPTTPQASEDMTYERRISSWPPVSFQHFRLQSFLRCWPGLGAVLQVLIAVVPQVSGLWRGSGLTASKLETLNPKPEKP